MPLLRHNLAKRFRMKGNKKCPLSDSCCADMKNMATRPLGNFLIFEKEEIRCMHTDLVEKIYTVGEYLALEERAKNKHEFYNGKIIKMPGGTHIHNEIAANLIGVLKNALDKKKFKVYTSDMKIHIPRLQSFVYPDAVVVFEKPQF